MPKATLGAFFGSMCPISALVVTIRPLRGDALRPKPQALLWGNQVPSGHVGHHWGMSVAQNNIRCFFWANKSLYTLCGSCLDHCGACCMSKMLDTWLGQPGHPLTFLEAAQTFTEPRCVPKAMPDSYLG